MTSWYNNTETNLLRETLADLERNDKKPEDVQWVGTRDGYNVATWADFAQFAEKINYDSGFGSAEIPLNLVVVGSDWWLERDEYDGAEGWDYKALPVAKIEALPAFAPGSALLVSPAISSVVEAE